MANRNIDKKYHYLYKTTNLLNDKYYYGIHSTNKLDDGYLGSGKVLKYSIRKYGKENFKREILPYYNSREELVEAEKEIITESVLKDKYNMNCMYGGEYWNTSGMVSVKDENGKTFKVFTDDPRYLSGELVGITKGFINVKDDNGNTHQVSVNDERYLSGELNHMCKGMIAVKDINNNMFYVSTNDERYLSGELNHVSKGFITVKDVNNNYLRVSIDDERYLSGELVSIFSGKTHNNITKNKMSVIKKGTGLGNENSQFGTCWIHKYHDKINKKIKCTELESYLNNGWIKGRRDFNNMISVNIYDLNNIFIENTNDIIEYCRINNYDYGTVNKVIKGKYKYAYNKIFRYMKNFLDI